MVFLPVYMEICHGIKSLGGLSPKTCHGPQWSWWFGEVWEGIRRITQAILNTDNRSNVVKTTIIITPFLMVYRVYTTHKHGDLGDGLLLF